jgi:2-aminomuconate deaminase
VEAALKSAGATMDDVVKITAFLVNADDYSAYAAVRLGRFPENGPASSTVIVKALVRPELLVEIEAVAVVA